jgi:hypothetical protein
MSSPTPQPPAKRPFSNSYLSNYSNEHVLYEIKQFYGISTILRDEQDQHWGLTPSQSIIARNTLVEGFVLHFRNIVDFLFPPVNPQPTDICADDFCQPGAWSHNISTISQVLAEARRRANKEIAHLTSNRSDLNDSNRPWNLNQLSQETTQTLRLFRQKADKDKLGNQVCLYIDRL